MYPPFEPELELVRALSSLLIMAARDAATTSVSRSVAVGFMFMFMVVVRSNESMYYSLDVVHNKRSVVCLATFSSFLFCCVCVRTPCPVRTFLKYVVTLGL